MKKFFLFLFFTFYLLNTAFSQTGEWVWIKGDSIPDQPPNFGVQGVPSPANNPPSLYEACEWTDLNGNFWLFGGTGSAANYGNLWKYDPLTNEWTWMKGTGTGSYGVQGFPSPSNNPPVRGYGVATWIDDTGNLWMYGGLLFNDLWKYDISTNEWTWMSGFAGITFQNPVYGTSGIPSPSNNPGARSECAAAWKDNAGDLWLFGGRVESSSNVFNDVWKYSIATNEWTWMKGDSTFNASGVYGTSGVENPANTPGARMVFSHWKDANNKFWLFAGKNLITDTAFNDLWRFNTVTNNWAWMGGSNTGNATGNYGISCISASTNVPGSRFENRASWTDQYGNFWTFGGAWDGNFNAGWNDLWMYCLATQQWIWESGDNTTNPTGSWGALGVSNPANKTNARGGAVSWTDHNGHLYLFGGASTNFFLYNDLWKYTIDTTCGGCPTSTGIVENNFTNDLLVFPNPTNSTLTISFSLSEKQNIELRIYNTLGRQIYFSKEEVTKGRFEKEIIVEKWNDGIYFLQLKTKEGLINRKVIVDHP